MRPDASVRIRPVTHLPELANKRDLDLWVHFDAKYRLEAARDQFVPEPVRRRGASRDAETSERLTTTRREDLLKMHAYRDAIRRSAGRRSLSRSRQVTAVSRIRRGPPRIRRIRTPPGARCSSSRTRRADRIPGCGPRARSGARVRARASSLLARSRVFRVRAEPSQVIATARPGGPATRYPRVVWLYPWRIARAMDPCAAGMYNVRAGDRRGALDIDAAELQAIWLLLYGQDGRRSLWTRDGPWFVQTREQLRELEYPTPRGSVYLCAPIHEHDDPPSWLEAVELGELATAQNAISRAPFVASWGDLLTS